jgi:hypothetical protein
MMIDHRDRSGARALRRTVAAGGAVVGAAVLALSLVTAPPDPHETTPDVRAVQFAAFAQPPAAPFVELVQMYVNNRPRTLRSVSSVAGVGPADIATAIVRTARTQTGGSTTRSEIGAATTGRQVDNAAPATTAAALPPIPEALLPIIGPIILFLPIIVLVILACPPCALFNFLTFTIPSLFIPAAPLSAVSGASIATVEAEANTAPDLTTDPSLSDSAPVATAMARTSDAAPTAETGKADIAQLTSAAPTTGDEQSLTEEAIEPPDDANEESAGPTVGAAEPPAGESASESTMSTTDASETADAGAESAGPATAGKPSRSSVGAATPESAKPRVRTGTARPVVRGPLAVGGHLRNPLHRENGGDPGARTGDVGDEAPTPAQSSGGDQSGVHDDDS